MTLTIRTAVARALAVLAALAVTVALVPLLGAPADAQEREEGTPDDVNVDRYPGAQRFDTARLIAVDNFPDADRVVIAKAENWPDALAGNYLAGLFHGPVLLVSEDEVQADTLEALEVIDPSELTILGGDRRDQRRERAAPRATRGTRSTASMRQTRYETAAAVAAEGTIAERGDTAIVATGRELR
jgi:hypothetical protein